MPSAVAEDADVVFNRANVALAKSKRLIASWLPAKTADELANEKTEEELDKEDRELFAPVPELLGVGAPLPKDSDGLPRRRDPSSMDALRKQLLGKDALRGKHGASALSRNAQPLGSKPLQSRPKLKEDSEDEEEGRASAIKSRRGKKQGNMAKEDAEDTALQSAPERKQEADEVDMDEEGGTTSHTKTTSSSKKRPASFLDELLAEKAKKKKKKKGKKGSDAAQSAAT